MPTPLDQDTVEVRPPAVEAPWPDVPLRITACAARTRRGMRRAVNEDALLVAPPLLVVADGVGGRPGGEEASALAVDVLRRRVPAAPADPGVALVTALEKAHAAVRHHGRGREVEGMATTAVAVLVSGRTATVAHVGDSRAYLWRDRRLSRLTADHYLVAALPAARPAGVRPGRPHPLRSVILRAVGLEGPLGAQTTALHLRSRDVLLLCSDGLCGPLPDSRITTALVEGGADPGRCAERLTAAALAAGGDDDITVAVGCIG